MKHCVCAIQMVSTTDVKGNLDVAEHWIAEAKKRGAELVVLPENFAVLDSNNLHKWAREEQNNRLFTDFLQRASQENNIWIVGGTIPMMTRIDDSLVPKDRVRAASLLLNNMGDIVARYDKMHLFDVSVKDAQGRYNESAVIEPGDEPVNSTGPWGTLGLSVCYDIRFPEYYAYLSQRGCRLFSVPSAFTYRTGQAHWETLLRARAIENQAWVIAANQGGVHSKQRQTWGRSMIVDPWGNVLDCIEQGAGLAMAEMDLQQVEEIRTAMHVQQHKRFDVMLKS